MYPNRVKKTLVILMASLLTCTGLFPQNGTGRNFAHAEGPAVPDPGTLAPRSALKPYPTRESALAGGESPYILEPGSWAREEGPDYVSWKTRVKIPGEFDGRVTILRIEGATVCVDVAVNGNDAGFSILGVTRAEFDITDYIQPYYNTIEIRASKEPGSPAEILRRIENHRTDDIPGIRSVQLISQPPVRIDNISAETSVEPDGRGLLSLSVVMNSRLRNPANHTVSYELISPGGGVVSLGSRELATGRMSVDTLRFSATIPGISPWNHETPRLYTLVVRNRTNGRDAEFIPVKIGFRTVSFAENRLAINGMPVPLAARVAGYGRGGEETAGMLAELKFRGINCVIVPGYPQPDRFYDICDSIGMYVCDVADIDTSAGPREIIPGGNPSNDPGWKGIYVARALSMYRTSELHSSVIAFSPAWKAGNGYCLYEAYLALKSAERHRPVVYPDGGGQWNDDRVGLGLNSGGIAPPRILIHGRNVRDTGEAIVTNNFSLTTVRGYAVYAVKQRNGVKSTGCVPVNIAPGESFPVKVPQEKMESVKTNRSVDIYIYMPEGVYYTGGQCGDSVSEIPPAVKKFAASIPQLANMSVVAMQTF